MHNLAIIGLGYVGLPLAVEFARKYPVVGFDIDTRRIAGLQQGIDYTLETESEDILKAIKSGNLVFTSNPADLKDSSVYIVTVPTPIDRHNYPDLSYLIRASETVGKVLKKGDIVIYESTVYPGCTEEDCVPVLERCSGLKYNEDFFCGYSPERINPGDKVNTLTKIKKVTSGSTPEIAQIIDDLYTSIIEAGTHKAPSIKVAEASKAIENAQRDLNISFMNELALIFDKMDIDTNDVLEAAATKWNFLRFKPGLVGGHCIGVDPYYLAHKAQLLGHYPQVILSGRSINNSMGEFIAQKVVKLMIANDTKVKSARVLILGITFKENCPDIRNTKVSDVYQELHSFGMRIDVYDPWADPVRVKKELGIDLLSQKPGHDYEAVILAVAHDEFKELDYQQYKSNNCIIFDTKGIIDRNLTNARL